MSAEELASFRLVGGTALSLQIGHRKSIDIDLFTSSPYKTIDFDRIDRFLETKFSYVDHSPNLRPAMGKSYFIGDDKQNAVKLDVFYTDEFIRETSVEDGIRMASVEEIVAMKLDVVQRGGRKKDFWDLHELFATYTVDDMLRLHLERYPFGHDRQLIIKNFTDFSFADDDFDPICLKGKYWQFIKEDIKDIMELFQKGDS
jgi:predicted nucleotidyltransferase component of viral defense system